MTSLAKNSKTKTGKKYFNEIVPALYYNFLCISHFGFLHFGIARWSPSAVTKNSTKHENELQPF